MGKPESEKLVTEVNNLPIYVEVFLALAMDHPTQVS